MSEPAAQDHEDLVRDRPKFVIVEGIWLTYGSGLILNLMVLSAVLTGAVSDPAAPFYLALSTACGGLCAYLLNRVVKNYRVHRKLQMKRWANKSAAGKAGIALQFRLEHHPPGLPEFVRRRNVRLLAICKHLNGLFSLLYCSRVAG